jgi:hypothetical protein
MILGKAFEPSPEQNRMRNHGDVGEARRLYEEAPTANLLALLEHRYAWLRDLVDPGWEGLELAGGIAVTKDFVAARSLLVTDFGEGDWLDREASTPSPPPSGTTRSTSCSSKMRSTTWPGPFACSTRWRGSSGPMAGCSSGMSSAR